MSHARQNGYDCVIGDRESKVGTYREFVCFDERQMLPEYAVIYRRQYDKTKVPTHMQQEVRGATGRNWQIQGKERGSWINLAPDVTYDLNMARRDGKMIVKRKIGEDLAEFNLENMQWTSSLTEEIGKLRPPMRT